ncbi:hypothetical protein DY000_02048753 [Brassica cretica]|uniref:F-box domain-containing protein n=1 Tax=Brassica cretica TaxID=69181 RepID=A0ABQ7EYR8_BRACR|nr:hypothetical protein DY000_02048753 [Brassica cretica]
MRYEGKSAIRRCSSSQLEPKNEREEECGLLSLPDDVALDCLVKVSRLDLVGLAMVSRSHRFVAESRNIMAMRYRLGNLDPYVCPNDDGRSGSSTSLINKKKIYVFGGCWDVANSSYWLELYDFKTGTWEFLFVFMPKMPLNIQQSVVIEGKVVYGVDVDGQIFHFTPSTTSLMFTTDGIVEPNPENRNDWFLFEVIMCRCIGGRILWRWPDEILWKEVKGLEELQQQHIIKICSFSEKTIAIFWGAGGLNKVFWSFGMQRFP